jgi:glycosyltransferase involved in cell wall biosynthesis
MKISIITPFFNEIENIVECSDIIKNLFIKKKIDYEHIFVDNASDDGSTDLVKKLCQNDKNIKLLINNQNYGILPSVFNSLNYCNSDYTVVSFAADLQDPVEFLDEAIDIASNTDYEIIYAIRSKRHEGFIISIIKKIYYLIAKILSLNILKSNVNIYQLIKDNVRKELLKNQSNNPFIPYLILSSTFKKKGIISEWKNRKYNIPKNNFYSLFDEAINAISNYSGVGTKISFIISFLNLSFCFFFLIYNIFGLFFFDNSKSTSGIPTIIIFNIFMFAALFLIIGIIAENINHLLQIKIGKKVSIKEKINF